MEDFKEICLGTLLGGGGGGAGIILSLYNVYTHYLETLVYIILKCTKFIQLG